MCVPLAMRLVLSNSVQTSFSLGLGGVNVVDFNVQRQAAFLQAVSGFTGVNQTSVKICCMINGVAYSKR